MAIVSKAGKGKVSISGPKGKKDKGKKDKGKKDKTWKDGVLLEVNKRPKKVPDWLGEPTADAKGRYRCPVTLPNTGEKIGIGGLCQLWGFCGGTTAGITKFLVHYGIPQIDDSVRKRVSVGAKEAREGTWTDRPTGYGPTPTGGKGKGDKPTKEERKDRAFVEKLIAEWE